jgi:hypothetical protein
MTTTPIESKVTLDERRHRDGKGGPLVGEYYGPFWGISRGTDVNGNPNDVIMVMDDGNGSGESLARKLVTFLNSLE